MIVCSGNLMPSNEQIAHAKKQADDSFMTSSSDGFNETNIPVFPDWEVAGNGVLLRLRNVEPHSDPWVARCNEPRTRRALFWLISTRPNTNRGYDQSKLDDIWFGCGKDKRKMKIGDWVVFNDAKDHWVMSDHFWRGASWQLIKDKS